MTIATRINHALWPHAGAALVSLLALAACGPEGIVEGAGGAAEDVLEIDELAEGESQDRTEEEGVEDASSIATESTETGDAVVASLPGQEAQAVPKRYTTDVRVMSFNTRIDKTDVNLDRLSTRTPRIKKVIAEYSPDIIGIQEGEKDTWSTFFNAVGSGYGWAYRTRGGVKTPNELVAVMYKTSRFELQENTGITITRKERRDRGGCPNNPGWGNRTVQRLKLRDKLTNEIIDVFNTHFVAGDQCENHGMARIAHD